MPVEKFRDARDMPRPPRVEPEALVDAMTAVCDWARLHGPREILRGVQKFRTLEAAQAARAKEDREWMRALRAARRGG